MKTPVVAIIDDSEIVSEIVTHVLKTDLEFTVVSFSSAEAAIRELHLYDPDIILLDYNLNSFSSNNMNGLEFLKKMKLRGKSNSVIMMSGQRDKRVTAEVLQSGAINYLSKNDENFLESIVNQVKATMDVLKIEADQKSQEKELRKRIIRITAFVLIPIGIAAMCIYYKL